MNLLRKTFFFSAFIIGLLSISSLFNPTPPSSAAQPRPTLTFTPLPTSTPPPTATPKPADDDNPNAPHSSIEGIVIDLSTGQPGRGVKIKLNEIEVLSDSVGHYSLTGLNAGRMLVGLAVEAPAQAAAKPIWVTLDGQNQVIADLQFYSQPPPVSTPVTATIAPPPPYLPVTGGELMTSE